MMRMSGLFLLVGLGACTGGGDDKGDDGGSGDSGGLDGGDGADGADGADGGDSGTTDSGGGDGASDSGGGDGATDSGGGDGGDGGPGTFQAWEHGSLEELSQVTELALSDSHLYAAGFSAAGEPTLLSIELSSGAATTLYSGAPLVFPTGLCVSDDGSVLYIADLAAPTEDGLHNGAVYSLDTAGGAPELLSSGAFDLPVDVAMVHGGRSLYVSAMTLEGAPAIYTLALSGGAATVAHSGAPLVDPVALDADAAGQHLYVLDSLAGDGRAAVYSFNAAVEGPALLHSGFELAFPGGLGLNAEDSYLYTTTTGDPGLLELAADGSAFEVVDTLDLLVLPGGVAAGADVFVSEQSILGGAQIYQLAF